ncbi:aspartate aminotransferase family protein [Paramagnetospirillum kuznetsovii]|uniref:Aspartate aminotransferase family protein n=1 Tax=Paramagnetospirillum kuznetsovii TaxID=2053833 RepID=A0A364NU35_9PROT|nr:aspartate aminotransferase family protein [Paramagnetospirillum kuznetsovii]RAU20593.1 aspartate aminotransferase family protein [Paramagnetospirillum kuznetsovii]
MEPRHSNRTTAERDIDSVLHPYTNLIRHKEVGPLVITHGQGVRVFDEAGKDYIEGLAGLWCTSLGWGEERLVQAASAQMRKLPFYHLFSHKTHDPAVALCDRLLGMAPVPMSKVFLAGSGSEANDTAIKLIHYRANALGKPAKKKIIAREKAYHGVTVATAALTGLPFNHRGFDLPFSGVLRAGCPHHYRFAQPGESEEAFSTRLAAELDALIVAEGPDTVAAFFAEPVMGAGGVIVPPAGYFPKIQAVLDKYDVLLVVDEVICGFGRTGRMFGTETFGIRPDMMTLAKGLSSGYAPISALMVNERVYGPVAEESGRIGVFGHGYTYGGHPVSAAVAVETLNIYAERDILAHIAKVGPVLQDGLAAFRDHPLVGEKRGIGLIGALELVADKAAKTPFDPKLAAGPLVVAKAQNHGVILRAMGDSVAFSPPLVISEAEIAELLRRFGKALDEAHGDLTR